MDWSPLAREIQDSMSNVPDFSWQRCHFKEPGRRIARSGKATLRGWGGVVKLDSQGEDELLVFFAIFTALPRWNGKV